MTIGTWLTAEEAALAQLATEGEAKVAAVFTSEEAIIVQFFGPLIKSIIAAGGQVVLDSAMAAATAASTASGDKVAAAEAAFVAQGTSEGLTVVHNAEAGAIKAAVAVLQANITPTPVATEVAPVTQPPTS